MSVDSRLESLHVLVNDYVFALEPLFDLILTLAPSMHCLIVAQVQVDGQALKFFSIVIPCDANLLREALELLPVLSKIIVRLLTWLVEFRLASVLIIDDVLIFLIIIPYA